jgi:hypothetical protein
MSFRINTVHLLRLHSHPGEMANIKRKLKIADGGILNLRRGLGILSEPDYFSLSAALQTGGGRPEGARYYPWQTC